MPRRSARIITRKDGRKRSTDTPSTEQTQTQTSHGKRKAEEDEESSTDRTPASLITHITKRRKQDMSQTKMVTEEYNRREYASEMHASIACHQAARRSFPASPNVPTPELRQNTPEAMESVVVDLDFTPQSLPPTRFPDGMFRASHVRQLDLEGLEHRRSTLPNLSWASSKIVWDVILKKELKYTARNPKVMDKHPDLNPNMRSILLDWLNEVCDVYRLHRETYYMAVDFFDRYMAFTRDIPKGALQLIGITSLFIASKMEEIYPPKLHEFAYVTDGACSEQDIIDKELFVMKVLSWDLTPTTPTFWLSTYLQVYYYRYGKDSHSQKDIDFITPKYSQHAFLRTTRLLDLCILSMESLQFRYSVLAATAMYLSTKNSYTTVLTSGYTMEELVPCINWMAPYARTVNEAKEVERKTWPDICDKQAHNIQTHTIDMDMYRDVQELGREEEMELCKAEEMATTSRTGTITPPTSMPTPPRSTSKDAPPSPPFSPSPRASPTSPLASEVVEPPSIDPYSQPSISWYNTPRATAARRTSFSSKALCADADKEEEENNDPQSPSSALPTSPPYIELAGPPAYHKGCFPRVAAFAAVAKPCPRPRFSSKAPMPSPLSSPATHVESLGKGDEKDIIHMSLQGKVLEKVPDNLCKSADADKDEEENNEPQSPSSASPTSPPARTSARHREFAGLSAAIAAVAQPAFGVIPRPQPARRTRFSLKAPMPSPLSPPATHVESLGKGDEKDMSLLGKGDSLEDMPLEKVPDNLWKSADDDKDEEENNEPQSSSSASPTSPPARTSARHREFAGLSAAVAQSCSSTRPLAARRKSSSQKL